MRHHQTSSQSVFKRPDHPSIARARHLARLLDSAIEIPILRKRIGLDPLLGLVPVWGDVVAALLACYVIWVAYELRLPKPVLVRMGANIVLDILSGAIPVVGDFTDMFWKANIANVQLLEAAYQQHGDRSQMSETGEVIIDIAAEPA